MDGLQAGMTLLIVAEVVAKPWNLEGYINVQGIRRISGRCEAAHRIRMSSAYKSLERNDTGLQENNSFWLICPTLI